MREKKRSLRFSGRRHARGGIISTVIAGIGWLIFVALCVYSSSTGGNAAAVAGILGILDAIFVLTGMVVAFRGVYVRDVFYVMPGVGWVLKCGLFVLYFVLYLMGTAII